MARNKILVLNLGSSSIKFKLYEMPKEKMIFGGMVEAIGLDNCQLVSRYDGAEKIESKTLNDHTAALKLVIDRVKTICPLSEIMGVGHRVVHGGEKYSDPTVITPDVIKTIQKLSNLAPLHNPVNLKGIRAMKKLLPKTKGVAIFDTAFHRTIPEHAYLYAIPYDLYKKHKIRKYGFHGTSHKYVMQKAGKILGKKNPDLITCHLGNGCSITAISKGKSVDTSMGFTPLQGLIMATRSGDIDAEIVKFLMKHDKKSVDDVIKMLNKESGLKGICGFTDIRTIKKKAMQGNKKVILAEDMFTYRVAQYIGSYSAILPKLDAIVFTGGIGQNASHLRKKICKDLTNIGIVLDEKKNRTDNIKISSPRSKIKIFVIPTDEELMIAKEAHSLLKKK